MHIAIVTTEFITDRSYAGGLANYTYRIAKSLINLGVKVTVVYLQSLKATGFQRFEDIDIYYACRVQPLPKAFVGGLKKVLGYFPFCNGLRSEVDRFLLLLSVAYGIRSAIDNISSEDFVDIVHYTHLRGAGALHDSQRPSLVRLSSHRNLLLAFGFPYTSISERFFEDIALLRSDSMIAPSSFVGNYAERKYKRKVKIVPSPYMAMESFSITQSVANTLIVEPYALYFGSICTWKGIVSLVHALMVFFEENTLHHFYFIGRSLGFIEGIKPKEYISSKLSSHNSRVHILDSLPHSELYPYIEKADFICLPLLADNFPNVVLEAMALRKCIISTHGHGVDDQLTDKVNCVLVPPNDSDALSKKMIEVSRMTPDTRAAYGHKAFESLQRFTPEICGRLLLEEYRLTVCGRITNNNGRGRCG